MSEGILSFAGPNIGHQLDDLRPGLLAWLYEIAEQGRDIRLHGDVSCAGQHLAIAIILYLTGERGEKLHRDLGMAFDKFGEDRSQRAGRHLGDNLRKVADGSLMFRVSVFSSRWCKQFADVLIPDALHLASLRALALLLRGDEVHQFITNAFIGDLCDLIVPWQIRACEIAEVARDKHTRRKQALAWIGAAELGGAFLETIR